MWPLNTGENPQLTYYMCCMYMSCVYHVFENFYAFSNNIYVPAFFQEFFKDGGTYCYGNFSTVFKQNFRGEGGGELLQGERSPCPPPVTENQCSSATLDQKHIPSSY